MSLTFISTEFCDPFLHSLQPLQLLYDDPSFISTPSLYAKAKDAACAHNLFSEMHFDGLSRSLLKYNSESMVSMLDS